MNLKNDLITAINLNQNLDEAFLKLDKQLLENAKKNKKNWNVLGIDEVTTKFPKISMKMYAKHLQQELGDVIDYNDSPVFTITINVNKLLSLSDKK